MFLLQHKLTVPLHSQARVCSFLIRITRSTSFSSHKLQSWPALWLGHPPSFRQKRMVFDFVEDESASGCSVISRQVKSVLFDHGNSHNTSVLLPIVISWFKSVSSLSVFCGSLKALHSSTQLQPSPLNSSMCVQCVSPFVTN